MSYAGLVSLPSLTQIKQSVLKALIEAVFISVIESNFIVAENKIVFFNFTTDVSEISKTKH